jgi:hypothetical protein
MPWRWWSDAASIRASDYFPTVLGFSFCHGLPLHVRGGVGASAVKSADVVDDMAAPPVRVVGFPPEDMLDFERAMVAVRTRSCL